MLLLTLAASTTIVFRPPNSNAAPTAASQSTRASSAPVIDMCEVRVADGVEAARLMRSASDFDDHFPMTDGRVRVYADKAEQARLRALGFELTVLQRDLSSYYAARAAVEVKTLGVGG